MMVPITLGVEDAGELLTLQRAAFVSEAQAYDNPHITPLTEPLDAVVADLSRPDTIAFGMRDERGRLLARARMRVDGPVAHLGRLAVAPDAQGRGLCGALLAAAERHV